ncbi:class I SAM-dependent methyltransferase [Pontibacillus litoralis]|uniref:Methyltransferase n=1 Tax=Pontibacillus litoralis JSM 072002 TaxID=1385512 RepID=A0A0A5G7A5_9BACI|nr:class I SAM-dependent methyltransferase [Pontibacillus litoralis]KGX88991.1 methyltransferase [Pontibacillus litoralis JSM 072002]
MTQSFQWHNEVKKKWDSNVTFWSERSRSMWENGSRATIAPFFAKHVPSTSSIADVGCGDGYGSYKLNQAGYDVTGIDLSPKMIEHASQVAQERLKFQVGDLEALPFADEAFDAVIAINSIEWTESPCAVLKELKRVVKPAGYVCVGLLGPTAGPRQNSYRRLFGEEVICNTMMPWEFEQMATETGWKVVDGEAVYKKNVPQDVKEGLSKELQQALSFMWLFMLKKS